MQIVNLNLFTVIAITLQKNRKIKVAKWGKPKKYLKKKIKKYLDVLYKNCSIKLTGGDVLAHDNAGTADSAVQKLDAESGNPLQ